MKTPMTSGQRLSAYGSDLFHDTQLYKSIIEALQYATIRRPEIAYCVNRVCLQTPLVSHWQAVKRILRYLARTLDSGLTSQPNYHQTMILEGYCDAN